MTLHPTENQSLSVNTNSSTNAGNSNTDEQGKVSENNNHTQQQESNNGKDSFGDTELNKGLENQAGNGN